MMDIRLRQASRGGAIETDDYSKATISTPWKSYAKNIETVSVVDNISPVNTTGWFDSFENCISIDVAKLDTSHVTDMNSMFRRCNKLESLDVSGFNTSNVIDMSSMFESDRNIILHGLSCWDVSKVTDMRYMFANCSSLVVDCSMWNTVIQYPYNGGFKNYTSGGTGNIIPPVWKI